MVEAEKGHNCPSEDGHVSDNHDANDGHVSGPEVAEEVLGWITVAILCIFFIEVVLKLLTFGIFYFYHHFVHMVDAIVVIVSLVLTVAFMVKLNKTAGQVIGLLILMRLWRVVRLVDSITMVSNSHHEQQKALLTEKILALEAKLNNVGGQ